MPKIKAISLESALELQPIVCLPTLDKWSNIPQPAEYIESQSGRYVSLLEGLLNEALRHSDHELARVLTLDLIKLSPVGRTKIDVNTNRNLAGEPDFQKLDIDAIKQIVDKAREDQS